MRRPSYCKTIIISILLTTLISIPHTIHVGHAEITHLKVDASNTSLKAGSNNNSTITIYNDFAPIYELVVKISFDRSVPNSPAILGVNQWKFNKINEGDQVELKVLIFVPNDAAGDAFTANLVLTYKRLGYISPYTEIHTLGFYAKGWIDLVFYDLIVEDLSAHPGGVISFTASILNKGNIPAMFTNVSLMENDVLIYKAESFSYLGQVDPNSPAPFTLEASVKPIANEGNYAAVLFVSYEDDEYVSHNVTQQVQFEIVKLIEETPRSSRERVIEYVTSYLPQGRLLIILLIGLVIFIVGLAIVLKRRSKAIEEEFL